jgi:hypothetical protein
MLLNKYQIGRKGTEELRKLAILSVHHYAALVLIVLGLDVVGFNPQTFRIKIWNACKKRRIATSRTNSMDDMFVEDSFRQVQE